MSKEKAGFKTLPGSPQPLGVSHTHNGLNFALFCNEAERVSLVVSTEHIDDRLEHHEFPLDTHLNRTGDIWHIGLQTTETELRYGYRIDGSPRESEGVVFFPDSILLDPYCKQLEPRKWGNRSGYGNKPLCLTYPDPVFDWQDDRPLQRPLAETIIYELHVRGFTRDPSSGVSEPGTYLGLVEKIPYLQALGITAVELLPVNEWDEADNKFYHPDSGELLLNYWGYNPLSYFALRSGLAAVPEAHLNEFRTMVRELHKGGIEVILDMVFNHSGETDYEGTTSVFRGISNSAYYMIDPADGDYLNYSGCGNTVNCNHPVVQELIIDSLRYFVSDLHVDGFRFDLAAIFSRDGRGRIIEDPPLVRRIAEDPVLMTTKIIAEAWDATGLYQVGSFSSNPRWAEWNGRYRDDVRRFMAGHRDSVSDLATRIAGSSDLYEPGGRSVTSSVNFITSHDGFTLYDLVSYDKKHNRVNGEDDRDGEHHNLSWNSGCEGQPCSAEIKSLRSTRIRTFGALLLLSQGVPMLSAGDEFGRSQQGNNNCWCQDNGLSWIDWSLVEKNHDLLRFFQKCIELRKSHALFRRSTFFQPVSPGAGSADREILWQSLVPGEQDWSADCRTLGVFLRGPNQTESPSHDFFIMINGHRSETACFTLPESTHGSGWRRVIDSGAASPDDFVDFIDAAVVEPGYQIQLMPMSLILLQSNSTSFMEVHHE